MFEKTTRRMFYLIPLIAILICPLWASPAGAFSVDVTKLNYTDYANPTTPFRVISTDFSGASIGATNNTITLPPTASPMHPPIETSYNFGPYPDPSNNVGVALGTAKATLTTATEGGCIINTAAATPAPYGPQWTYEVQLGNFTDMTDGTRAYTAQIGFGSDVKGPHPEFSISFGPGATSRSVELNARIYNDATDETAWGPYKATLNSFNSTNSIILRIRNLDLSTSVGGLVNMVFDYSLDGGTNWTVVGILQFNFDINHVPVPEIFPHQSFPAKFPFVSLWVGSLGSSDPFQVFSSHEQWTGNYKVQFSVDDSGTSETRTYSSITVESVDILEGNLGYLSPVNGIMTQDNNKNWHLPYEKWPVLGTTLPSIKPTYKFTAKKRSDSTTVTEQRTIAGYVADFVNVTSPTYSDSGITPTNVTAAPTFGWSWSGATAPSWYNVYVSDFSDSNKMVWSLPSDLPSSQTSVPYTGPLVDKHTYQYSIMAGDNNGNSSTRQGYFTYTGASTISFYGAVMTFPNWPATDGAAAVSGATVNALDSSASIISSATTGADGAFAVTGIAPSTTFRLVVPAPTSATTYMPVLSKFMNWNADIQGLLPFALFTQTQYNVFGITSGNGMIIGRVADQNNPLTFLPGATIVAREWTAGTPPVLGTTYDVTYTGGAATGTDGLFMVKNVPAGKMVQLVVTLTGYTFQFNGAVIPVQAGAMSEESFFGAPVQQQSPFNVYSYHQDGGYFINIFVDDPTHTFTGVTVSGPGLTGEVGLTYVTERSRWEITGSIPLGSTLPTGSRTYNFTAAAGGTPVTGSKTVSIYVADYASNLQPTGDINNSTPTFSWTGIGGATGYSVYVIDVTAANEWMWTSGELSSSTSSVIYGGPALNAGHVYQYTVISANNTDGNSNSSFARAQFTYTGASTVTVSGFVKDWNGNVITSGVNVSLVSDATKTTTASTTDGSFSLSGVPANTVISLKFTASGHLDVYSADFGPLTGDVNISTAGDSYGGFVPINMPMANDLTAFGAMPNTGKAVIAGRVRDNTYRNSSTVGGVGLMAQGLSKSYQVTYRDPFGVLGGSTTYGNGRYYVLNVDDGDTVTVTASKSGWSFPSRTFHTHGNALSQGQLWGTSPGYNASLGGFVKRWTTGAAVPSATIALNGDPGKSTVSGTDGSYTFGSLPKDANFYARITASDYVDLYAGPSNLSGSMSNVSNIVYPMLTATEMTGYGVAAGNGIIIGAVVDMAMNHLSGATITVTNKMSQTKTYTVTYDGGGNATSANGKYYISDILPGDVVKISTTLNGYTFSDTYIDSFAPHVNGKYLFGTAILSAVSQTVAASATTGSVTVTVGTGVAWTAVSNADWVHITSGASGTGSGSVSYTVDANTGGARQGTITIAGQTFTINQASGSSTVTVSGIVKDWNGNVIPSPGVTVSLVGGAQTTTSSTSDGSFSLSGVPANTVLSLKFSATGYLDVYTVDFSLSADMNISVDAYGGNNVVINMPTTSDLTAFGAMPNTGKGVITGRASDNTYRASSNVGGVTISAASALHPATPYAVTYRDPFGVLGGSTTWGNGRYYVLNVDDGDTVTVTASKTGWGFGSRTFHTHGNALDQGRIWGTAPGYNASVSGYVRMLDGTTPISGATIALNGDPGKSAVSGTDGSFTFNGLPQDATFYVKVTGTGYVPTYAGPVSFGSTPVTGITLTLGTPAEMTSLGVSSVNGLIGGIVTDQAMTPLSGATVTLTSRSGTNYMVNYLGGSGSTSATGRFVIPNILSGDTVKIDIARAGYTFVSYYLDGFAGAATTKYIIGTVTGTTVLKGDVNGDTFVTLADAILALQVNAGMTPPGIRANYPSSGADVNSDASGRIGLQEVIYILQYVAGLRP